MDNPEEILKNQKAMRTKWFYLLRTGRYELLDVVHITPEQAREMAAKRIIGEPVKTQMDLWEGQFDGE